MRRYQQNKCHMELVQFFTRSAMFILWEKNLTNILDQQQSFWKHKSLEEMNETEWESLCDRCGRCCLVKLEDEDSGKIHFTDVGCKLLSLGSCTCSNYEHRQSFVSDCIRLTPEEVRKLSWLPPTCGYRLVRDGEDLKWWHPLISGSLDTVHEAGVSVRGRVAGLEDQVDFLDLIDHIVQWPTKMPKKAK